MSVIQDKTAPAVRPSGDRRRLVKTNTPGVFKRVDGGGRTVGYQTVIRVAGKQRKRNARTFGEARRIKRESETDRDRGELQEPTTIMFLAFLLEWIERYRGQGRRGFREGTRDEYRRLIENYAVPYFSGKLKLVDVTTYLLARFVDWLADEEAQGKRLSDATIANIVIPLRASLTSAHREGLIRNNPSLGLTMPHREATGDEEDEEIKVFDRDQLAAILAMAPDRYKVMFELLATTGLRISEVIGLKGSTCNSTGRGPRSASVARSCGGGSCLRRPSTGSGRSCCRDHWSIGFATILPRRKTRTRRRFFSRTRTGTK